MRSFLGKTLILGVAIATTSLLGCSNHAKETTAAASDDSSGTVGLALQAVPGVTIDSIHYTITGNGVSLAGSLDVSGSASSAIIIGGIPVGSGYMIALDATSTNGNLTCAGSATFDVARGTTTSVSPHLQCRKGTNGGVGINPVINVCPTVDGIAATPASGTVGVAIALAGSASDDDHAPSALTYAWTATSGTLEDATAASPSFTCAAEGTATLGLTVSDGDCTDTASISVACAAAPPPPVVTTESVLSGKSAACLACAQLNGCVEASCETASGDAVAGPAAGTSRAKLCVATLSCVLTSGCASSGVGTPCYCGSASGSACLATGAANGVCKTDEENGLESTDPASVATGFGDPAKGGGIANALVQCLNDSECGDCFH